MAWKVQSQKVKNGRGGLKEVKDGIGRLKEVEEGSKEERKDRSKEERMGGEG